MKISRTVLVVCMLLALGGAFAQPAPARAAASVAVGFFYDSLTPYGQWVVNANFGTVWRPARVSASWRPYWDGRWVYTDYGWTFLSDEPWGWATYHYGRWYFDPYYGWLWVPDDEWGPSWVSFYSYGDWIGWAPLAPTVSVRFGVPLRLDPRAYCFVEERRFLDPQVGRWAAPSNRNVAFVREARVLARPVREGGRWVARGPSTARLESVTRQRVPRLRVVDTADPRHAGRAIVRGGEVSVYRPRPQAHGGRTPDFDRRRGTVGSARPQLDRERHVAPAPRDTRGQTRVLPRDTRSAPHVMPRDTRSAPHVLPRDTRTAPRVAPRETRSAPRVVPRDTRSTPHVVPRDTRSAPRIVPRDTRSAPHVVPRDTRSAPRVVPRDTRTDPRAVPGDTRTDPRVAPSDRRAPAVADRAKTRAQHRRPAPHQQQQPQQPKHGRGGPG